MSGAKPPQGYETDVHSLLGYLKGGKVPRRGYFCWGLHGGGFFPVQAVQWARFGKWKAVSSGIDKPIEIYDLDEDVAESNDLAKFRPELVQRAKTIFAEA